MNLHKLPKGETQKVIYANKKGEETFVASHKILGNYTLYSIGDNKKLTKVTTAENPLEFDTIVFKGAKKWLSVSKK